MRLMSLMRRGWQPAAGRALDAGLDFPPLAHAQIVVVPDAIEFDAARHLQLADPDRQQRGRIVVEGIELILQPLMIEPQAAASSASVQSRTKKNRASRLTRARLGVRGKCGSMVRMRDMLRISHIRTHLATQFCDYRISNI